MKLLAVPLVEMVEYSLTFIISPGATLSTKDAKWM
jgi:hypothetical protein